MAHIAPHDPRQYPDWLREKYQAADMDLPPNFAPRHAFDNGHMHVRDEMLEGHPRRPDAIKQHIADYYALIHFIDQHLGRIWSALEDSGQLDNTIIAFGGDNGLAVGQHGLMGKQNMYDHSLRVPLILSVLAFLRERNVISSVTCTISIPHCAIVLARHACSCPAAACIRC